MKSTLTLQSDYWTYKPKLIPSFVFEPMLEIMTEYCKTGVNGKRYSSVFFDIHGSKQKSEFGYGRVPTYNWEDGPSILHEICKIVENFTKEKYDYVLVHIYPSGSAGINWHNDKEAMNSSISSVSLGATRKFRMKKIGRKKGWDREFYLGDGDLIWMHGPNPQTNRISCQQIYYHTVPVEKTVKNPRINLTFRQYE